MQDVPLTDQQITEATVTKADIEGHIYFLADDLLKGRDTGTPENKIAASYLANTLRSYGVKPNPKSGDYYQKMTLEIRSRRGEPAKSVNSQNVIGYVEGTDPTLKNEFVIFSAHYDHVGVHKVPNSTDSIFNGARDNAVGTTTVLSMAKSLAKHPGKRSALFILFTGEEKGLLGSRYYVENPVFPLNQMVYCFNSDNGGYNDTSITTIIGLERTTVGQHIKDASQAFGLTAIDDPAGEQGLFDRSDNVNFAKKGIPAPTFSLGFRSFDGDVTKYYHQPIDEAHTLDYDYLEKFFKAYVLSGRKIINDPKTPTWTAGDKYEEASRALYGK
ncbi:M28 family peptidase [Winogradskyella maritima]|uniref:M28 family peptidase n=1 Tax=Winogradskyella maritima TaxID=1517766 RepID=A0ABV8AMZ1_9FLAO|nr:M28 family peptidase [Winogradskyella maritima]